MNDFKTEGQAIGHMKEVLTKSGAYFQKTYLRFTSGFPDLVVIKYGRTAWFEVKLFRKNLQYSIGQVEPIQWATLKKMHLSGAVAFVLIVKNREEAFLVSPYDKSAVKITVFSEQLLLTPAHPEAWNSRRVDALLAQPGHP